MSSTVLTWHGHANFQIVTPNQNILIDPWFEGNPSACIASGDCGQIDLILVTHDHDDHIGPAVQICQETGANVMAIVETANLLLEQGVPAEQIVNGIGFNVGGTVEYKGVQATMVQAFHSSGTGSSVGYILQLENGYCLYHAGDTGIFSSMELFGQLYDLDLALLPIGGVFTMDPRQAALACKMLGCRAVVPMHWGSFPILEQNTAGFQKELDKIGAPSKLWSMEPGQSIELNK